MYDVRSTMYDLDYSARCAGKWVKGEVDNFDHLLYAFNRGEAAPRKSLDESPVGEILRAAFLMNDCELR